MRWATCTACMRNIESKEDCFSYRNARKRYSYNICRLCYDGSFFKAIDEEKDKRRAQNDKLENWIENHDLCELTHWSDSRDPLPSDIKDAFGNLFETGSTWFNRHTEELFMVLGFEEGEIPNWQNCKSF